jgi:uncharacterized iron-regulated membrane protein
VYDTPPPRAGLRSFDESAITFEVRYWHSPFLEASFDARDQVVEAIDAATGMPGPIDRVGRDGGSAVVESGGKLYRSDPDVTHFEQSEGRQPAGLRWSAATPPAAAELEVLQTLYRGRGLTVERVLADVHSGRIFATAGTLVMDAVAVFMIVLSLSGFVLWLQHSRREAELERRSGRRR